MPRIAPVVLAAVLALAAVNLGARLDREMVDVWDESLYATTALEMVVSGDWVVTTFQGAPDYYNSKPPLNVWLIALWFKLLGVSLHALRLTSVLAAAATVAVVWRWTRQMADALTAHVAALVLVTSYPFLYVHSARTGNPDALMTLAVTLTFVVAWHSRERPGRAVWLGPLAGVVFMLKGLGALAFVVPMWMAEAGWRLRRGGALRPWLGPWAAGVAVAGAAVALWVITRWRADGWALFEHMVFYDVGARATGVIEGHDEAWWFYGHVLTRYWYDWLGAAALIAALSPATIRALGRRARERIATPQGWLVAAWLVTTVLLPTLVPTRLAWYLHPFYPGAAIGVALLAREVWRSTEVRGGAWRRWAIAGLVLLATGVAEGRLVHRTRRLDLDRSAQGLLLEHRDALAGHRVFATFCPFPEAFLAAAAGSACVAIHDLEAFTAASSPGDFWLDRTDAAPSGLTRIAANRRASLHRRP